MASFSCCICERIWKWNLRQLVNRGELDRLLLRPVSPVLQLITMDVSIHGFGSVLLGAAIMLRAVHELELSWNVWQYLFLGATLFSSVLLIGAILQTAKILPQRPQSRSACSSSLCALWPLWQTSNSYARRVYYPGVVLLGKLLESRWLGYLAPFLWPARSSRCSLG